MRSVGWRRRLVTVAALAVAVGGIAAPSARASADAGSGSRDWAGAEGDPAVSRQAGCPPLTEAPVPLGPEGVIPFGQPTFAWRPVPGIHEYVVLVLLESDQEQTVWLGHAEGTSITAPPLPAHTRMRWKVKTECDERYGPFSAMLYFTIEPPAAPPCPPTRPPAVFGPHPGRIDDSQPTFSWQAVPGATSYTLYVMQGNGDGIIVRRQDIHATVFTPEQPLPVGVPLRWKVKAESPCGPGPYSSMVYFDVGPVPACGAIGNPTVYGPQGTLIRNRPLFRFGKGPGATFHMLWVFRTDTPTPLLTEVVYGTTFTPPADLPVGVPLRWILQGGNGCADGAYSNLVNFQIR